MLFVSLLNTFTTLTVMFIDYLIYILSNSIIPGHPSVSFVTTHKPLSSSTVSKEQQTPAAMVNDTDYNTVITFLKGDFP